MRIKFKYLVVGMAIFSASLGVQSSNNYASAISCKDIEFVFARGSGETKNDISYTAWREAIQTEMKRTTLSYGISELDYPAVAVALDLVAKAVFDGGETANYSDSVNTGVVEIKSKIASSALNCPKTKFVLGGYSQGAQVMSLASQSLNPEQVIYIANFGDPKTYLPEGFGIIPDACVGKNLSSYREYVPDCRTAEGILGGYIPYNSAAFNDKIGLWCKEEDIMCGANVDFLHFDLFEGHTTYVRDKVYEMAAKTIVNKVIDHYPASGVKISSGGRDTAILIDTTGSMGGLIGQYKVEAKKLAKKTVESGGRIALYEYRDLSDPFETVQHCDFSCSYDEFVEKIDALEIDGGGDTEESTLSGILHVMNTLTWKKGATKSIVLLTDAGYHMSDIDGVSLADVQKRSLEIDPVNIYAITSVPYEYEELTRTTGGKVFSSADDFEISTDYIMSRPEAILPLENYSGKVGQEFLFDASKSSAEAGIDHFEWDLDFDGEFEVKNGAARMERVYSSPTSGFIQVKAVDKEGRFSTMSAKVEVMAESGNNGVNLSDGKIKNTEGSIEASFKRGTGTSYVLLVVDDVMLGIIEGDAFTLKNVGDAEIILVPFGENGERGEKLVLQTKTSKKLENGDILEKSADSAENGEKAKNIKNGEKLVEIPKTPNCGRK